MEKIASAITIESEPKTTSTNLFALIKAPKVATPDSSHDQLRVLPAGGDRPSATSLAYCFADDEVSRYFLDTPDTAHWSALDKWHLHLCIMRSITSAHFLKGLAVVVGAKYECVALWMPPGQNMDDSWTMFRCGMWTLKWKLSTEGKARWFEEFLPLLHKTKAEVLGERDDKSWYLVYLGTLPEARGKGYAKKTIEYVTRIADANGQACYLESSNDINPIIYGKHGFKVVKKIHLTRGEKPIELDIMVREPKPIQLNIMGSEPIVPASSPV